MSNAEFIVDFVARGEAPDEWMMVLVETGPWHAPVESQLSRLQNRLYDCMDAAIDGKLAQKFPESEGKRIVIQVDGYALPTEDVREFFTRFSEGAAESADYAIAIQNSRFVHSIKFRLRLASKAASSNDEHSN